MNKFKEVAHVGADTRFSVGGGANPWGRQHTSLPDFPKNCMKLRKFWSGGRAPLDPPLVLERILKLCAKLYDTDIDISANGVD